MDSDSLHAAGAALPPGSGTDGDASFAAQRQVLDTLRVLLRPLVRLLLRQGIKHQQVAELLKSVFLDVAGPELRTTGRRPNASLLSLATGVHRKDVARLLMQPAPLPDNGPSIEAQVFTRWLSDPAYLDESGRPRVLPRVAGTGHSSFESLARSVTSDVHPRAVLDALARLGLLELGADDGVRLVAERFVPTRELEQMLSFLRDNNHDHLAASVANTLGRQPPFLEQSLFATGLTEESAERLHVRSREAWTRLVREIAPVAERLVESDAARTDPAQPPTRRVRVGMYFYTEVVEPSADEDEHVDEDGEST